MSNDPHIQFQDAIRPNKERVGAKYTARAKYDKHPKEESYGPIRERGVELEYTSDVDSVETLHATKHLAGQLHQRNLPKWEDSEYPNDGTTLYDLSVLNVIEETLEQEGLEVPSSPIDTKRVKIAFLEKARCESNRSRFCRHLSDSPQVCQALGYESPKDLPSRKTIANISSKTLSKVFDECDQFRQAFENAAVRAAYACYRNGVIPPDTVRSELEWDEQTAVLSESTLKRSEKRQALRNWVRFLKDETLDPLTFGRQDPHFEMFDLIGLLATSALIDEGLESAADIALWDHKFEDVPKGTGIPKYIKNRIPDTSGFAETEDGDVPTVEEQFKAVHSELLALADDLGFFADAVPVAVDIYEVEWTGGEAPTIGRAEKRMNDVTEEWTFLVAAIIDNGARFTLGAELLTKRSQYPAKVKEILPGPPEHIDVEMMMADAEMVPGELISAFRSIAGNNWIIKARNLPPVKVLRGFTPKGHAGFAKGVKAGVTPKPNLLAYPNGDAQRNPELMEVRAREIENPEITEDVIKSYKDNTDDPKILDLGEWGQGSNREDMSTTEEFPLPSMTEQFNDPRSKEKVGKIESHIAYLTDRDLTASPAADVRADYFQRWAIEESINQISNDFMPGLGGSNSKVRLYGVNVAILLQNWHTMINRARSPELGHRLDVTHCEVLKAIQEVAFGSDE